MELELINVDKNLLFKHPFTLMIAGATSSGKTQLARNIVTHLPELITPEISLPIQVNWSYGIWTQAYGKPFNSPYVRVSYVKGLPKDVKADVLVVDDLMTSVSGSEEFANIFMRGSHHQNMSVIFIVQNLFHQGRRMRDIGLNCHYLILTKNRRDLGQITTLGRQLYGNDWKFFIDAYKKSVLNRDYGYLLIDLTPTTEERYRLRANICPPEHPITLFVPSQNDKTIERKAHRSKNDSLTTRKKETSSI